MKAARRLTPDQRNAALRLQRRIRILSAVGGAGAVGVFSVMAATTVAGSSPPAKSAASTPSSESTPTPTPTPTSTSTSTSTSTYTPTPAPTPSSWSSSGTVAVTGGS